MYYMTSEMHYSKVCTILNIDWFILKAIHFVFPLRLFVKDYLRVVLATTNGLYNLELYLLVIKEMLFMHISWFDLRKNLNRCNSQLNHDRRELRYCTMELIILQLLLSIQISFWFRYRLIGSQIYQFAKVNFLWRCYGKKVC